MSFAVGAGCRKQPEVWVEKEERLERESQREREREREENSAMLLSSKRVFGPILILQLCFGNAHFGPQPLDCHVAMKQMVCAGYSSRGTAHTAIQLPHQQLKTCLLLLYSLTGEEENVNEVMENWQHCRKGSTNFAV